MNDIILLEKRSKENIVQLIALWERSVRVSHSFLTSSDIVALLPDVEKGLLSITTLLCTVEANGEFSGFLGLECDKVEMLFVDATQRGKGLGKKLLRHAIEHFFIEFVDVNEQNLEAIAFYRKMGFIISQRSDSDEQGRPFPLLHMSRA